MFREEPVAACAQELQNNSREAKHVHSFVSVFGGNYHGHCLLHESAIRVRPSAQNCQEPKP